MDNSLIPRAFSPTDAKRRAEDNAREAERRSSARNTSSATIPDGGVLTLAGGIEVVDGGTVKVVGYGNYGSGPYEVSATLATSASEAPYSKQTPGLFFESAYLGQQESASIVSDKGSDISIIAGAGDERSADVTVVPSGASLTGSSIDPAVTAGGQWRYSRVEASESVAMLIYEDSATSTSAGVQVSTNYDGSAVARFGQFGSPRGGPMIAGIVTDGSGNVDIQTTGTLTQNGAPISGGGGAVSSVAGKTGAVTLVKADVGLDQVDNTSDLAKPVSTATQTALNGKVNTGPQHAEFTLSAPVPTGGPLAAYTVNFAADAANTTGAAFATTPAAGKIGLPAGTYAVHHYSDCGASMGSGAVLAIQNDAMTKRFGSLDVVSGSYNGSVNHPCIYLPTAQNITPSIAQFSGATRTANVRVYIEKIK